MRRHKHEYLIDRGMELFKFGFTVALLGFLIWKAPNESAQIISLAAAFILGGTKVREKLGF
ncbi:MAG TPA: hypothetical protein VNM40_03290 [Candidatus Paceibacterota bacterium]|nr:hypothetical protein [Candidatus Paceibacterota bacterium]